MTPFASSAADRIDTLGESALIERLRSWLGEASPPSPQGIGDDCSAIPLPKGAATLLTTADPVLYRRHFDDALSPEQVAQKLLRRNISDIAAMGGSPHSVTLSLALPSHLSLEWLRRFYLGLRQEALERSIQIAGGDVSATDDFLGAFMTLTGFAGERVLERGKGASASPLYVTGSLGGSLQEKHFAFEPRLPEGQWLVQQPEVLSCMDLSDGLGKDCAAMVPPGLALRLEADRIPISPAAAEQSRKSGRSPLDHALNDGEDYELLFALAPDTELEAFESRWQSRFDTPLSRIGSIVEAGAGATPVFFDPPRGDITFSGYEHFRAS